MTVVCSFVYQSSNLVSTTLSKYYAPSLQGETQCSDMLMCLWSLQPVLYSVEAES